MNVSVGVMSREWRKVEGMGRNELIAELVELRGFHDKYDELSKTIEKVSLSRVGLCECTNMDHSAACNRPGVSCCNRCMECEENCE